MEPRTPSSEPTTTSDPGQPINVPGLIGMLLAAAGIPGGFCLPPLAFVSALGLGLSIIGLFRTPRTLAIAGVVIGLAGTIFGLVMLLAVRPASVTP